MKRLSPKILAALGFIVYFASYVTRINYGAVISEIVAAEGIAKSIASLAVTFAFISYGVGQLVSGYIGDKISPQKLILFGLLSSAAMNILMTVGFGVTAMCILWTINGFAQSLIWPPLVRILASGMSREEYNKACVTVNAAGSLGTVFVYLTSPLFIQIYGWELVFFFSAAVGIIAALLFFVFTRTKTESVSANTSSAMKTSDDNAENGDLRKIILSSGLLFICLGILFQGTLRDGIQTWTPSFLSETYSLPTTSSIFTSVLIPLFSIFSIKITSVINSKFIKNELTLSVILFSISAVCTALSTIIRIMPLSVFFVALATGCMHGINLMLVCQIPGRFVKYGKASFISGSMNFFTYVGSAISTYGIAVIAEHSSWSAVLFTCSAVALLGLLMCVIANKNWKTFSEKNQ